MASSEWSVMLASLAPFPYEWNAVHGLYYEVTAEVVRRVICVYGRKANTRVSERGEKETNHGDLKKRNLKNHWKMHSVSPPYRTVLKSENKN